MGFFNKRYFIILAVLVGAAFIVSSSAVTVCWDGGMSADEEFLEEKCGVSPEEYMSRVSENRSFCPEGYQAIHRRQA